MYRAWWTDAAVAAARGAADSARTVGITGVSQVRLQAYVDPGTEASNELHLTAFDDAGHELPLEEASAVAVPPTGAPFPVVMTRLEPGYFSESLTLQPGAGRSWSDR